MTAITSYAGGTAALVIRALLDFRSLWTTHDLVTTTGVPAPLVRRVINRLEQDELVDREAPGVVGVPSWLDLLRRWAADQPFNRNPHLSYWRPKPRSPHVLAHLPATPIRHAVTGACAAHHWAPETPAGPPVIYTPDVQQAAAAWDLVPARTKIVVLVEAPTALVYTRTRKTEAGLRLASPSQVLADLLTGATRSPSAAEPLTTWMLENPLDWRY